MMSLLHNGNKTSKSIFSSMVERAPSFELFDAIYTQSTFKACVRTMIKVDVKRFITDRCWYGWYYWNPPGWKGARGNWERSTDIRDTKRFCQYIDWSRVWIKK